MKTIKYFYEQKTQTYKNNAFSLKVVLLSKDLGKFLKKIYALAEKIPRNQINHQLIITTELYFQMMDEYSNSQVISLQEQEYDDVGDEDQAVAQEARLRKTREKHLTYLSELGIFLDYNIVNIYVRRIMDVQFTIETQEFKEYVTKFFRRIIVDLKAEWIFY